MSTLHVNTPSGLGEAQEQHLHAQWDTIDAVMVEVMKEGFAPVERPNYAPPVLHPEWLDALTPEKYHLLTAQLSAWKTYAQTLVAMLEGGMEECDNEMSQLSSAIKASIRRTAEKKPPEEAIKDEVKINPRYNELVRRRQTYSQKKRLIEPHYDRYSRELRILSRTLEMRRQELETGGRGDASPPHRGFG